MGQMRLDRLGRDEQRVPVGLGWSSPVVSQGRVFVTDVQLETHPPPAAAMDPENDGEVLRPGAHWNPVVGRIVGHPSSCGQPDCQIAGAAAAVLSFRTLAAWRMGFHSLPGVLCAVDGGILGRFF